LWLVLLDSGLTFRVQVSPKKAVNVYPGNKPQIHGFRRPPQVAIIHHFGQLESIVKNVEPIGVQSFLYLNTSAHQVVSSIPNADDRAEATRLLAFPNRFSLTILKCLAEN
jgi:hypothetical protein